MRIGIANNKRVYLSIIIIFLAIIIIAFKVVLNAKSHKQTTVTESKSVIKLLSRTADGNVLYEENEFFKKYKITLSSEQKNVNFTEESNFIKLILPENESVKLNMDTFDNENTTNIYKKEDSSDVELYINKDYESNNFVYLDSRDKKSIIILVSKKENPYKYKVQLDPGHGGVDPGTSFGEILEKNINLKIVKYMVNDLRYNGCLVKLSRDEDSTVRIEDVAKKANEMGADVLISVHINDFKESKYSGVQTHYNFFTENEERNKNERIELSKIIQKHIVKDDEWKDRGISRDKLKLLRLSEMPCVLIECGFLSNPSDRERLQREEVLMNLAKNINNGVLEFLNSK
jgi:N-acetylmuramoyl-L-alanine amidase